MLDAFHFSHEAQNMKTIKISFQLRTTQQHVNVYLFIEDHRRSSTNFVCDTYHTQDEHKKSNMNCRRALKRGMKNHLLSTYMPNDEYLPKIQSRVIVQTSMSFKNEYNGNGALLILCVESARSLALFRWSFVFRFKEKIEWSNCAVCVRVFDPFGRILI